MQRLLNLIRQKEHRFEYGIVLLTGLWLFLIPFGKGEQVPAMILAILGLIQLIRTKGQIATSPAAKSFLLLLALYLIPIAISMFDAPNLARPFTVLATGLGSGLAGLALISGTKNRTMFRLIAPVLAAVIGFWLLDSAIQAVFGRDLFGLTWDDGRLSGPFLKKAQMGYYSGPFSAFLLIYALHKKWKPLLLGALLLFTTIIVLLNNSRGGWIMFGVVAIIFGWQAFIAPLKHKALACTALILLGLTMVIGLYYTAAPFRKRADQTLLALQGDSYHINRALSKRLPMWIASVNIYKAHPINGVGARNFREVALDYWPTGFEYERPQIAYPHQCLLEYAVGTGTIGLIGLIASFILCIHWWKRADKTQRKQAAAYAVALLAVYFPLNTQRAFFDSEVAISLWIILALYLSAICNPSTETQTAP